ncbi:hypothetical protein [Rubrivivax gelatinosus]|uniref:Uncharacterized protein n=1 Tax=Rubrivivax gelatinosus TaxID=28068 RepID=A0A4R2LXF8_RUBGE|nr:hypothetical protein [Rubrivivax gelatinosus]TCO99298.1 hypothetical protein EV684_11591 [Rubrivivax gelatinosus]
MEFGIVPALFAITLLIALVFGLYQYRKVMRARREGRRSVQAEVRGEPPSRPDRGSR